MSTLSPRSPSPSGRRWLVPFALRAACFLLVAATAGFGQSSDQRAAAPERGALRVGVTENPPFARRDGDRWVGLVPDVWSAIGQRSGYRIEYVPLHGDVAAALKAGAIDVGPPMTISAERVRTMPFTPPLLASGLAVATVVDRGWNWSAELSGLWTSGVFRVIGGIVLANVLVGLALWAIERKRNPSNFGGAAPEGVASGIWCSIATMMTVGYGDRVPITWAGRALCFVMMLSGVIIISLFTASATSALTVSHLQTRVHTAADLRHVAVAAIPGSDAEAYLRRHACPILSVPDAVAARQALTRGDAAAFVDDRIALRAAFEHQPGRFTILPLNLEEEFFAFPITSDAATQRRVIVALQEFIDSDEWDRIDAAYLGE
jgi:ABC-type amino acid transport substrate-binding protein